MNNYYYYCNTVLCNSENLTYYIHFMESTKMHKVPFMPDMGQMGAETPLTVM